MVNFVIVETSKQLKPLHNLLEPGEYRAYSAAGKEARHKLQIGTANVQNDEVFN